MKIFSKTGNILTSLILIALLIAGFLYWKMISEEKEQVSERGFVTYEEHLKRRDRDKAIKEIQDKIKNFFENFRGR